MTSEAGKQIDQENGLWALASKAPNEMSRIGYRGRGKWFYRGNNRTERQHGLKMSKQSGQRGVAMYEVGCGGEHKG